MGRRTEFKVAFGVEEEVGHFQISERGVSLRMRYVRGRIYLWMISCRWR